MAAETISTTGSAGLSTKSFTRFLPVIGRVLMGLPLLISGLNGLFNFLPQPDVVLSPGAMAFAEALMKSGYMMPLIFATQLIVGALLLSNRFVPLGIVLIAPFIVNSMAFHIFLEHSGLPVATVFLALELYLAWRYRQHYVSVLTMHAVTGSK